MQPVPATGLNGRSLAPLSQQPAVKAVHVYRNGDPFFQGRRLLIHEKRVGTFEVFLKDVTSRVQAPFGAVRNIYTPRQGHRVMSLEDLKPGEHYVAGGRENFKKLDYLHIGENKKKPVDPLRSQVKPVSHSRINVSARFRKNFQEPCTVFLIANGDVMNPVIRLLIPRKVLDQWELVLALITDKIKLRNGAVHKLYTLDGTPIQDGSELENGQFYVAVGRDKFKKLPYNDLIFAKTSVKRSYGSKASSLPPINGYRKSQENRHERQTKSTGGSTDTVDNLMSPQPPKSKAKVNPEPQVPNKPVRVKQKKEVINVIYHENDDGIFKAGKDRSEMRGASEVQEDENTKVEVPVDQRVAETVEEEVQDHNDEEDPGEEVHNNNPTDENEDYSTVSHKVEAIHRKLNNGAEEEINNDDAEVQEDNQHLNSEDPTDENLTQINGDIDETEEGEEEGVDGSSDENRQARRTSSRLLEKASTPTDTEKKDLEPEA